MSVGGKGGRASGKGEPSGEGEGTNEEALVAREPRSRISQGNHDPIIIGRVRHTYFPQRKCHQHTPGNPVAQVRFHGLVVDEDVLINLGKQQLVRRQRCLRMPTSRISFHKRWEKVSIMNLRLEKIRADAVVVVRDLSLANLDLF